LNHDANIRPRHCCNESAALSPNDSPHFRKALHEDCGHLIAREISIRQDEGANGRTEQSFPFVFPVPDSIVFRQKDPSLRPDDGKPVRILCVRREMVVVNLNDRAGASESVRDLVLA